MSATVIDSLLVLLGLDTTPYKKGAGEAKKITKETEGVVKKSSESMVKSLRTVGLEFVSLFLAVKSVSDVVHYLTGLSSATRQLGIDAKNFGTSAAELRDWQNAAVLAGGSAEDVTKTIGGLQQSLFNLKFNGQVNDQIITLQRLGVNFRTATNQVKPFNDVMIETAGAIERSHLNRQDAFNFLQQAGFDKGSIQLILGGTAAVKAAIEQQRKLLQVSDADVAANTRMQQSWDLLKEKIEAGSIKLLTHAEPAITKLFDAFNKGVDWVNSHQDDIGRFIDKAVGWVTGDGGTSIIHFFKSLSTVVETLASGLNKVLDLFGSFDNVPSIFKVFTDPKGATDQLLHGTKAKEGEVAPETVGDVVESVTSRLQPIMDAFKYANSQANEQRFSPAIAAAETKYGIPRGLLTRLVRQESSFNPDAKSEAGAVGLLQLMPKYFKDAGKNPLNDINSGANYLAELKKQFGTWELAAAAYNAGPGKLANVLKGKIDKKTGAPTVLKPETTNYVKALTGATATPTARITPAAGGQNASNTSVQIDSITVNTQATNAGRMAADMEGAVQRKLFSAHADGGVT